MNTRIYIDGYNLYYGCLKGTPYKWLNLESLFVKHLLPRSGNRRFSLVSDNPIKFYTAEITDKAAEDPNSVNDQRIYHAALKAYCCTTQIIKGSYSIDRVHARKVERDVDGKHKMPKDSDVVQVWKFEEKQSDVNIAVDAIFDACTDRNLQQLIFVTNDTDLVPTLKKIRLLNEMSVRESLDIGLIIPSKDNGVRRPNQSLVELADWTIDSITDRELRLSQLPVRVIGGKKPAIKPVSWFKYSQEVKTIVDLLVHEDVLGSTPRAWRWLCEAKPEIDGLPSLAENPSTMLDNQEGIASVRAHAEAFSQYKKRQR